MASVTGPSPHQLMFPGARSSPCAAARRSLCPPPPPSAFPSQSLSRAPDSALCHCRSNGGPSDAAPPPPDDSSALPRRRWDSAIQDLLRSAMRAFDSYVGARPKEPEGARGGAGPAGREGKGAAGDGDGEEEESWDWDRWKRHFEEIDGQERLLSILKSQLSNAVVKEDYEEAGRLKVAIAAASTGDTVGRVMSYLKSAINEERYHDAAFMRDNAGAGLVGWWAGTSNDTYDPYGVIIRVTAEHGRYVARSYSPRQLVTAAGGVPLFEVFLKVDKKGKYGQQAVYLKQREVIQDPLIGSVLSVTESNTNPADSIEGKNDVVIAPAEDEEDGSGREDGSDLSEQLPGFQNILRDMIPGVRVKVMKVTAPGKVDKDLIAKVIEQMMDDEEEEDDVDAEDLEAEDEVKSESDQERDEMEMDAIPGVIESEGKNEFAVKVVVGGLVQKLSANVPTKDLLRVPAMLEKKGRSSFCFSMIKDVSGKDSSGRKQSSVGREAKFRSGRSIDQVMLDLAKFIGGEKIPMKVLKDVGELISLTLSQTQSHRSLSGSTTFNRIEIPSSFDPLNGLYIGAHGIYSSEVIQLRRKFGQWQEDGQTKDRTELEFYEYVEALKLTGDRYVPAGKVAFRAKIGKKYQLPHKGIIPEELGVIARYKGQGRLAEPGFQNPRWVDGELVILDGKYIKGGPVVGFVYWAPEYHFLVFFNRLKLQD
ncbi:hypothetical protein EUGRSUZ_G00990 [Eucalyptus grandis]|uniref:Uncharacterized protein n=2 Tax=Eucalyptus grandis TaxID=71139 RepID=A0ACC3K1H7_EUCGR|nr:hypothetical protein EUGRSUZ_G00990 [Eucalyptus grandis]KAK3420187.1 hypothetical protein EUGRSUZ_G00990 [Eucalyptus grandis]